MVIADVVEESGLVYDLNGGIMSIRKRVIFILASALIVLGRQAYPALALQNVVAHQFCAANTPQACLLRYVFFIDADSVAWKSLVPNLCCGPTGTNPESVMEVSGTTFVGVNQPNAVLYFYASGTDTVAFFLPPGNFNFEQWYPFTLVIGDSIKFSCDHRGDVNIDFTVDLIDIVSLIGNIFFGDPLGNPLAGDVDCSGTPDVLDAIILINFVFLSEGRLCCL